MLGNLARTAVHHIYKSVVAPTHGISLRRSKPVDESLTDLVSCSVSQTGEKRGEFTTYRLSGILLENDLVQMRCRGDLDGFQLVRFSCGEALSSKPLLDCSSIVLRLCRPWI